MIAIGASNGTVAAYAEPCPFCGRFNHDYRYGYDTQAWWTNAAPRTFTFTVYACDRYSVDDFKRETEKISARFPKWPYTAMPAPERRWRPWLSAPRRFEPRAPRGRYRRRDGRTRRARLVQRRALRYHR